MIIYKNNGVPIIDIEVDDSSYRYRQIMGRDEVLLEFSLAEHVELPVGAYLVFENDRYDLLKEENVTVNHSRNYEYKITFSGPGERARNYIIHNIIDKRLKFDLTAKPSDHLAMIVANMNERDGAGVWSVGTCIDKKEMTISYNHTYCIDGLGQLADECDTEYEIVRLSGSTYAINLGKVEYYKSNPLSLGYGKENGFVPGVSRESSSASLEKVWIEGGDKNISLKSYGASLLHLPENLSFSFDGSKFSGEAGYDRTKGVSMKTDSEGYSVKLASAPANATEGSLDVTGIYPKRVGEVTAIRFEYNNWYYTYAELIAAFPSLSDEDWENVQIDIVDNTIPASLDYAECLMVNDQPLTVIFQSGPLAGREFDATFQKESRIDTRTTEQGTETVTRPANRFELKKADHDGVNMPTRNYLPATGNEYVVVNCVMPEAYVSDPESFGGAEYDALREAAAYLYENKDMTRSYRGTIDGLFAKRDWVNVSSHLKLGSYVSFSHSQVQATPIAVRILACKQYINKPHKPEIEISNEIVSVGKSTTIQETVNQQAHVEALNNAARRFSRRGFRDAKETAEMLIGAALEGFDPSISPIAIQTMQLLAGDESLQFKFWTSRACVTPVSNPVWYDQGAKVLHVDSCVLQHMTLGINSVSSEHATSEYLLWNMSAYESAVLAEPSKRYYVYAKVDAMNDGEAHLSGTFMMSETAIGMRSVTGYYYLLVGMLMSENDNDRSFAPMFGFTEILPGQITTDIIRSSDGNSYFDLAGNKFRIGNAGKYLAWNVNNDGVLRLRGNIVQSPSGAEFPVPCNRGDWSSGTSSAYYGDQYAFGGESWICIDPSAIDSAHTVTSDPESTSGKWLRYAKKGDSGKNGKSMQGPSEYDSGTQYYGINGLVASYYNVVCVKNGDMYDYYQCLKDCVNIPVTNTEYWAKFNQFELVATKALVVDDAAIKRVAVEELRTATSGNDRIEIKGSSISVYDTQQNQTVKIHTGHLDTGTGDNSSISLPYTSSRKEITFTSANPPVVEIGRSSLLVTNENNSITLPALHVNISEPLVQGQPVSTYFEILFATDSNLSNQVRVFTSMQSTSAYINIPEKTVTLPPNTSRYHLYLRVYYTLAGKFVMYYDSSSALLKYNRLSTQIASDGMMIQGGTDALVATEEKLSLIKDGSACELLGGGALNSLVAPKMIVACTTYPSVEEQGVLYVKVKLAN